MTTPDRHGRPEDNGTLELFGLCVSTSARSIRKGHWIAVLVEACEPLRTISLTLPSYTTAQDVSRGFGEALRHRVSLSHRGRALSPAADLAALPVPRVLQLTVPTPGGKGGFGSMLRAQGGKMSSKGKDHNTNSCRDLSGRRLSTMKQAQKLADYLAAEEQRKELLDERQKQKYNRLEKMLGRTPKCRGDFEEAAKRMQDAGEELEEEEEVEGAIAGPSQAPAKRKERIEDEFVEQSREIVENVRSAVASAMLKKRKKKKTLH